MFRKKEKIQIGYNNFQSFNNMIENVAERKEKLQPSEFGECNHWYFRQIKPILSRLCAMAINSDNTDVDKR